MVAEQKATVSDRSEFERVVAEYRDWLRAEQRAHPFPGAELDTFVQSILSPEALIGSAAWGDDDEEQELEGLNTRMAGNIFDLDDASTVLPNRFTVD